VAQLGARLDGIEEVVGSNPIGSTIAKKSREKPPLQLQSFLLRSPLDQTRSVLTCRAICSVAGRCGPAFWVFPVSGFHRFFATKPISSETNKQNVGQMATMVLSGTRGP
jgi:hypothetical protein